MRDITRQGIYRIIYDVVKADTLISSAEIGYLKKMCDLYDITPEYRESAMNMSLATAMAEIKTMPVRQAATFIEELQQLSLSDGICCREEALLLLAIKTCLTGNKEGEVVSVPCGDLSFDDDQVLFVENGFDPSVNDYINRYYSSLLNGFKVGGFDFVYMPKLVDHLRSNDMLNEVVLFLAPTKTREEAVAIAESMQGMTTETLYRELILGKLNFDLDISRPCIMFRIGFSVVNGTRMANYLVVPIHDDMLSQVDEMVSTLMNYQKTTSFLVKKTFETPEIFVYAGFYRTLFDLMTYRQGAKSTLIIHPYSHESVLSILTKTVEGEYEETIKIGPKESAFYVFLIKETLQFGGFNIAGNTAADIKYLVEAQKRFESVYFALCNRDTAPDITDSNIRRPMLSKIKKAIEQHSSLVQKMTFCPETSKEKVIKVHLGANDMMTLS